MQKKLKINENYKVKLKVQLELKFACTRYFVIPFSTQRSHGLRQLVDDTSVASCPQTQQVSQQFVAT